MTRLSGTLVALAGLLVLGAVVGLWMVMRDDAPATPPASDSGQVATSGSSAPSAPARVAPSGAARTGTIGVPAIRRPTTPQAPSPAASGSPALTGEGSAEKVPVAKPPMYLALRELMIETEPMIADCIDQAHKRGTKLDGAAAFGFTLAREGDKVIVTGLGIEYAGFNDQATAECMRDAASKIDVDTLPEGVNSVTAFRKVTLKDGVLEENAISDYSTIPPTRTPFAPPPPPPDK